MESYRKAYIQTGKFAPMKHFMVGVFALAFGLETYHHHKHHGGEGDAAAAGADKGDAPGANAASAASAKEQSVPSSMNDVMAEVRALREEVRHMRGTEEA